MGKRFETGEGLYFGLILHARFIKHPNKVQTVASSYTKSIDTVHICTVLYIYIYILITPCNQSRGTDYVYRIEYHHFLHKTYCIGSKDT